MNQHLLPENITMIDVALIFLIPILAFQIIMLLDYFIKSIYIMIYQEIYEVKKELFLYALTHNMVKVRRINKN